MKQLDHVAREESVLRDDAGVERELRDAVRDEVEVRALLHVLGEELEEPGVVDGVIVVVARVHVEQERRRQPAGRDQEAGNPGSDDEREVVEC